MRLYPPAPVLMRRTIAPVTLGGMELGVGTTITVPVYVVHRHRRLWRDPLNFDPSRFAAEAKTSRHRCAYMPFGGRPADLHRRHIRHGRGQDHARYAASPS